MISQWWGNEDLGSSEQGGMCMNSGTGLQESEGRNYLFRGRENLLEERTVGMGL